MKKSELYILDIVEDTMVDGPGFRTTIYCAGCPNHCPGCHNPKSWDINNGHPVSTAEIMKIIEADPYANVTFSGGDPMFQPEPFARLAEAIRQRTTKTIWCYTGFCYEDLLTRPACHRLLQLIDVLVDGPYIEHLRSEDLIFRGSSNQRLIDVPASLMAGHIILWDEEQIKMKE